MQLGCLYLHNVNLTTENLHKKGESSYNTEWYHFTSLSPKFLFEFTY